MIDRNVLMWGAVNQWGKPYQFGAKWPLNNLDPQGPIDCSGFSRWVWAQIKIEIPEGSTAQHLQSTQITPSILILPGDLMFLRTQLGPNDMHHVGLVYDKYLTIEARGIIMDGKEAGSVQFRTRKEWEARQDFIGYWRPKTVLQVEGA